MSRESRMAGNTGKSLRFTHIRLKNWRNFVRVGMGLHRRAFLIGPSASGKSNLLDAFQLLQDLVCVGGGFQEALRRRGGVSRVRCLAARQDSDLVIHVRLGNNEDLSVWEYELQFGQDRQRRPVVVAERVARNGFDLCIRPDKGDERDPERLTQTCLEQASTNEEFREVADFFRGIRYVNLVPESIRRSHQPAGTRADPFGGDLLERIARTSEKTQRARLRRIRDALRGAVPQLDELEVNREDSGRPHLRAKYRHWRPRGAWQSEDQFSDGTLRLIGLLWETLEGSGPLLLEEPELSLHPGVVRTIPRTLAGLLRQSSRQLIVTTHCSSLVEAEQTDLEEVQLLVPGRQGTRIRMARDLTEIKELLEGDATRFEEAETSELTPDESEQLGLFMG